jgi:chorismate mutase
MSSHALPRLVALRGATTVAKDEPAAIVEATGELLRTLLERNAVRRDDLVSVMFTSTGDLCSEFPAAAARSIGISDVPLLCATEIAVPGSIARCIRVMVHLYSTAPRARLQHVYLRDATHLRTDLRG